MNGCYERIGVGTWPNERLQLVKMLGSCRGPRSIALPGSTAATAILLVDDLLDQLQAASSGLTARAAIQFTRHILDGNLARDTSRRHFQPHH